MNEDQPDMVERSGREAMTLSERIGYLEQDVLWLRAGRGPVYNPKEGRGGPSGAAVHDFNGMIAWASGYCTLFRRDQQRGEQKFFLELGEMDNLSRCECEVIAWKRGGHEEQKRVRNEWRRRKNDRITGAK